MILVRDRCTEKRHDSVAQNFIDGALVAMDRTHHRFDSGIKNTMRVFRVGALNKLERSTYVGKQNRYLLAFAF